VSPSPKAAALLDAARARGIRIATAESCTGGLVSAALTEIPGASDVFDRGFVTYSYPSKTALLGVAPELLETCGAVSEQVVRAMAEGAIARSDAQLAIATTGVAGPGASDAKPEGLVWIGVSLEGRTLAVKRAFGAIGRAQVRAATVDAALDLALQAVGRGP
jgi:nicotinamide-nucleotide amidase